jgi:hypothetical protein
MTDKNQLYIPEWLALSKEVRVKLAEMFNLKRDIATEVIANQVVCDGYSNEMLKNMSLEAINEKGFGGPDFLSALAKLLKSAELLKSLEVEPDNKFVETHIIEEVKEEIKDNLIN